MTPRKFVGTTTLFFAVINLAKLPNFIGIGILDIPQLLSIGWVILIIPLAIALSRKLIDRIDQRSFEWIMIAPLIVIEPLSFALALSKPFAQANRCPATFCQHVAISHGRYL